MSNNDWKNRTLTLERTFNAPINLVWEAWTQAEHIAKWWGPEGMDTKIIAHDFREGGAWKYAMVMHDGKEFIGEGIYSSIVEMEHIFTSADFKPMTEGVEMRSHFEEAGNQTHFTFHVIHPTEAYCKQQKDMGFEQGWGSVFDRLGKFLG